MPSVARNLKLDTDRIQELASMRVAYARYRSESNEYPLQWQASNWLIAATLQAVIDQRKASELFMEAGSLYQRLGHRYWRICAINANDSNLFFNDSTLSTESAVLDQGFEAGSDTLLIVLSSYWLSIRVQSQDPNMMSIQRTIESAEPYSDRSFGRVGIPLRLYLDAMYESLGWERGEIETTSLRRLALRADEYTARRMLHRTAWKQQSGSMLPLEPEIIAVFTSLMAQLKKIGGSPGRLLDQLDINPRAIAPILVAMGFVGLGENEEA